MSLTTAPERMHLAGTKLALRDRARRWKALDDEVKQLNAQIDALVTNAALTQRTQGSRSGTDGVTFVAPTDTRTEPCHQLRPARPASLNQAHRRREGLPGRMRLQLHAQHSAGQSMH